MPLTISKLKMWKNPGYTRGCLEVPPAGSWKLPAPDFTSAAGETYRPLKDNILTAIELPLSYLQVFDMSYIYIEASDGGGTIKVFGWIDHVSMSASSSEAVKIYWSVDWWRTYAGSVTWGAGRITRCSDATRKRPVTIQPRYRTAAKIADIKSSDGILWIIISYRKTSSQRTLLIIPVNATNVNTQYSLKVGHIGAGILHDSGTAPSFMECMSGALPSLLGIQSGSIDGAWVSPICPLNDYDYIISGTDIQCHYQNYSLQKGTNYAAIMCIGYNSGELSVLPYKKVTVSVSASQTNDLITYAVTDFFGNIAGIAPYGMSFSEMDCILDVGNVSASIKVILNTSTGDHANKTSEGMTITLPLPQVPVSSSAYSDYVYSGQRDYEMQLKSLQNEQQAVQGLAGAATGTVTGAVTGAIMGSVVPGAGTAVGAVAGAVAGGAGSAISAGTTYAVNELLYKEKFQDLEDQKYSNQSGNLMIPGDGFGWLLFNSYPQLITMTADSTYQSELTNYILQEGYPCDSPVSSVSSFITSGGPLQIRNLTLTGAIPPVAKQTIRTLLEGGVRIVEKNPSGVVP